MSTCQHCLIGNAPHRLLCTTCGTALDKPIAGSEDDLSALWRIRFDLIEKAGGPTRPLFKQLSLGERLRLGFNLWAFLFGPFYYLAKGMWRKAVAMLAFNIFLSIVANLLAPDGSLSGVAGCATTFVTVWFVLNTNINYYKKIVLDDNGWW